MVAQRLTLITPPAATPDQLWQRVEAAWSAVLQEHIQSLFESMPRCLEVVISNNGSYSGYRFWQEPHFTEVYKFNHLILGQHVIYKINFVVLSLVFLAILDCFNQNKRARPKHLNHFREKLGGHGSLVVKVSDRGWLVTSSSPVPLLTRRVGERCTLNLSRAQTSSRWWGGVVRRGGASSGVVHVT
ncbi:uncharacterized protein TNCV_488241 [Trichonephila clavipes]|nr:uncharacterized protein TNCV_488241 [Trichonephila clavipes]